MSRYPARPAPAPKAPAPRARRGRAEPECALAACAREQRARGRDGLLGPRRDLGELVVVLAGHRDTLAAGGFGLAGLLGDLAHENSQLETRMHRGSVGTGGSAGSLSHRRLRT